MSHFAAQARRHNGCERELQTREPTDRGRGYVWLATFSILDVFARVGDWRFFFAGALLRARGIVAATKISRSAASQCWSARPSTQPCVVQIS
jgi:hypothetical protein